MTTNDIQPTDYAPAEERDKRMAQKHLYWCVDGRYFWDEWRVSAEEYMAGTEDKEGS